MDIQKAVNAIDAVTNRKKEYMLKEYTSNLSVSDGSDFFANEEEAWNNLKRLLPKNAFGVLYVLHRAELPAIN